MNLLLRQCKLLQITKYMSYRITMWIDPSQTLSGILAYFSISSISWTAELLSLSSSPGGIWWWCWCRGYWCWFSDDRIVITTTAKAQGEYQSVYTIKYTCRKRDTFRWCNFITIQNMLGTNRLVVFHFQDCIHFLMQFACVFHCMLRR